MSLGHYLMKQGSSVGQEPGRNQGVCTTLQILSIFPILCIKCGELKENLQQAAYGHLVLWHRSRNQELVVGFIFSPFFPHKSASEWVSSDLLTVNPVNFLVRFCQLFSPPCPSPPCKITITKALRQSRWYINNSSKFLTVIKS